MTLNQPASVSVIVPVRNENEQVLLGLQELAKLKQVREVIIVDASDQPATIEKLQQICSQINRLRVIHTDRKGRSLQMNLGAELASGEILWFVHADTKVPKEAVALIQKAATKERPWGRFNVRFDNSSMLMMVVATAMNLRSNWTNICTGDQAIFIRRDCFQLISAYPEIKIMEDIAISKILAKIAPAKRIKTPVVTSARRWEQDGYLRTILKMWLMRLLFYIGVSPNRLAKIYRQVT